MAVLLVFAAVFVALRAGSLVQKSATWDEPIHLTAGHLAVADGDYRVDPSHPPFLRMWAALPLLAMDEVAADTSQIDSTPSDAWLEDASGFASRFLYGQPNADRILSAARFMVVLWGVGLGILIFCWAREWLGFAPAVVALAFYTIEPNIAAHSRLVTTDLGASVFIFGTVYWLWRTCRRPSGWNIAGLAVCFALAFVTKFSAVVLVPIVCLLLSVAVVLRMRVGAKTAAGIGVLLAVSAFAAIWIVYGFRYAPSASEGWLLHLQDAPIVMERAPALAKAVAWVDARHVLPNAFTQGFLMSQASAQQMAYLAGEYSDDGWWHYFPVAFFVKTPLALSLLLLGGVILLAVRRRQFGIANDAFVVLPVMVYMGFAMASGVNIGVRHILPIYPFVLLIAAAAAKALAAWRRPVGRFALAGMLALWCAMFAHVYPHMLTYFSVVIGGPGNGLDYLADSNLDWGQDLKLLKGWMERRNVAHINLAYFGTADPGYYGIESTYLPGTRLAGRIEKPELPGYVAISATILSGVYLQPQWRLFYSAFRTIPPVDRIGNSIYVFWVDRWPDTDAAPLAADAAVQASLGNELFFGLKWADPAIPHYRAALERDPDDLTVIGSLGVALLETGKTGDAVDMFERAASLDPANGQVRYRLALALLETGRSQEAAAHAEAAARLRPDDPGTHDLLGVALATAGRLDAAEASFRRALQLAPGHDDAREHLRRLQGSAAEPSLQ